MKQLFYNKKNNLYYLLSSQININTYCNICKKIIPIGKYLIIHKSWGKRQFTKKYYCPGCARNNKKMGFDEFITAVVETDVPEGSILITDHPPTLKTTTSVFEAAFDGAILSDEQSCEVIDKTKTAGRESIEGAVIGCDVKEPAPLLSESDITNQARLIMDSKPIIPESLSYKKEKDDKK